jgi:cytochrome P450
LNAIIAGRDTSAQALSWTFFRLLSSDPSLLAKLKEEVDRLGECTYESYKVGSHSLSIELSPLLFFG